MDTPLRSMTGLTGPRVIACKHCGRGTIKRPRGLCWPCYYNLAIRQLYPILGIGCRNRGVSLGNYKSRKPHQPTTSLPGTEERLLVLEQRAMDGLSMYHPGDAQFCLD